VKKNLALLLTLGLIFLSGCWDRQIIEELSIALCMGIDVAPEPDLFYLTTTNPTFSDTALKKAKRLVSKGYTLVETFANMQRQRNHKLVLGQVASLVFSEEAAKEGLLNRILLELDQIRDVDPDVFIMIVRGASAREVLYLEPEEEARVARYLSDLIDKNIENGTIPRVTAANYWFSHDTVGIDSVVPVIELAGSEEKKKGVIITGLAAFDDSGKMKGVLSDQQAVHFLFLTGQGKKITFATKLNFEGKLRDVSMYIKKASPKIKARVEGGKPVIAIKLEIEVDIIDIVWNVDVTKKEDAGEVIAKALARDIQGNALKMISQTQDWGTDILGLGQHVRVRDPKWFKGADWIKEYPKCEISLEVKVKINRIGTVTNPEV
jgi:Ger(x)C family germination protein